MSSFSLLNSNSNIYLFPVNGGFSKWSSFSSCSKTCDDGVQIRTRSCTKPRPAHGGKACTGETKQSESCKIKDCASKRNILFFYNFSKIPWCWFTVFLN